MMKRGVSYNGLDCLADASSDAYMKYKHQLQAEIPWVSQTKYAKYTVYFGIATIFVAFVKQIYYKYRDYTYRSKQSSNFGTSLIDIWISYCRYYGYKQLPTWLTYFSIPGSVGSALYMFLSSLYMLCYCLVPHFWYRGCAGFGSSPLAVRAGLMATALTPFIYVLAGKSNAITLLTGISYEKLNTFHQYTGVACFILSVIHVVPFIYQDLAEGGSSNLKMNFKDSFEYYSGIPPLILLGLLCILSKSYIRKVVYELFLHAHWMMGIAYFGTLIWHINKELGADDYMWGALAFWATQIIYRILMKTAFKPNAMFLRSRQAQLEKLGSDGVYQVVIGNTTGVNWKPGQHCYLRFAGVRILDNHPFSIASVDEEDKTAMKFIIKAQKGLTRKIYQELDKLITSNKNVYVDGPYGGTFRDPRSFERVVLLATGTGVTATLPFLTYLAKTDSIVKRVSFIWIVRLQEDIHWVKSELQECQKLGGSKIDIHIHVAAKKSIYTKGDFEKEIESEETNLNEEDWLIDYGKPSVTSILKLMAGSLAARNMIVCSGSDSLKREVSSIVSELQSLVFNNDLVRSNVEEIYLHTESFGW
ncbi:putative ferric reductase transmembrane component, partial [Candida africana]